MFLNTLFLKILILFAFEKFGSFLLLLNYLGM